LLIGFWYQKPEAASAAKKAFLTTRLGDLGLLVGILIIYLTTGSFVFSEVEHSIEVGALSGGMLTIAMLGVFLGAVGKSAQFPLHVWLPDAMEGPTPVSALIHAATMVAAGVYLVARTFEMFVHTPDQQALLTVAYVGGFTAIFAASMGLVMNDIKKVMAYSTISQLGYMMMGLGVGAYAAGVFHLFNHAFFKALLFLGSGSVIYAAHHEQDMRNMGGLGSRMKITFITMSFAGLALAGFPPFSGFWSKDEILAGAYEHNTLLYIMGSITALFTAFYIFRALFLTFTGKYRGASSHDAHGHGDAHGGHGAHGIESIKESPAVMTIPLILLAIPSLLSGLLGSPFMGNAFQHFIEKGAEIHEELNYTVMIGSIIIATAGIFLASLIYYFKVLPANLISGPLPWLHAFVLNKYGMDDLYLWIVNNVVLGASRAALWFDINIVDGIVNGVASMVGGFGGALRRVETGLAPNYALAIFAGAVVISGIMIVTGTTP
jgi:NADH-quinone oxidoreductase subunit L